jgi:ParB family transcriptional regulator, chromosome partitioning protein
VFAAGGTVLLEVESRRVLSGGTTLPWNSPWIDLEARCPEHPEHVPWRELLGDFCPPPVLVFTPAGKPIRLAKKEEAIDALLRNGIDLGALRSRAERLACAIATYGIDAAGIEKAVAEELAAKRAARVAKATHAGA